MFTRSLQSRSFYLVKSKLSSFWTRKLLVILNLMSCLHETLINISFVLRYIFNCEHAFTSRKRVSCKHGISYLSLFYLSLKFNYFLFTTSCSDVRRCLNSNVNIERRAKWRQSVKDGEGTNRINSWILKYELKVTLLTELSSSCRKETSNLVPGSAGCQINPWSEERQI